MSNAIQVGTITVREPVEVKDRSFQNAGWWRTMRLEPGVYAMHLTDDSDGSHVEIVIDAVNVEEYFGSMYGGVALSTLYGHAPYDQTKHAGRKEQYHIRRYPWDAASYLDRIGEVRAAPGWALKKDGHRVSLEEATA
jgi:hypothetical protein